MMSQFNNPYYLHAKRGSLVIILATHDPLPYKPSHNFTTAMPQTRYGTLTCNLDCLSVLAELFISATNLSYIFFEVRKFIENENANCDVDKYSNKTYVELRE